MAKDIHRKCGQCGVGLDINKMRHDRSLKYCSVRCYGISQRRAIHRPCDHCGKEFAVVQSSPHRFCSNACRGLAVTAASLREFSCKHCGKTIIRPRSMKGSFCNRQCYNDSQKKPDKHKTCTKCGIVKHNDKMANTSWCKQCSGVARAASMEKPRGRHKYAVNAARIRGLEWSIAMEEHLAILAQPCDYCGGNLNARGVGLDRIDNNRGYHMDNVVPCCGRCNRVRGTWFTYDEMKVVGETIAKIDKARHNPDAGGGPSLV